MSSITVHNIEPELDKMIRQKAEAESNSLNKTIKNLLRNSLGLSKIAKQNNLDRFYGVWSKEEADEFDKIINQEFEKIDPNDWK